MGVEDNYNQIASEVALDEAINSLDGSGDNATQLKADVNNGSVVGRNRLIMWFVAYFMTLQQDLFALFKSDTKALALDGHFGTRRWFVAKALEYQYGDPLIFTRLDAYYDPVVPENRIVSQAACVELGYKVIVKAIKTSGGSITPLSSDERNGLQDYFDELRPPVQVEVRSADSDRLRFNAEVVTDAKLGTINVQSNVEAAVNNYLSTLDFNGAFSINKLRQAILSVPGVIDVVIDNVESRISGSNNWVQIPRIHISYAGWMTMDQSSPLSEAITYTSSNV